MHLLHYIVRPKVIPKALAEESYATVARFFTSLGMTNQQQPSTEHRRVHSMHLFLKPQRKNPAQKTSIVIILFCEILPVCSFGS